MDMPETSTMPDIKPYLPSPLKIYFSGRVMDLGLTRLVYRLYTYVLIYSSSILIWAVLLHKMP